jgi:hypothetical protein
VWWITAVDAAAVEAGLAGLAARLCPVTAEALSAADAACWATGWLQAHDRWLLVLDNVEDPADVEPLLGQVAGGHVIVASRMDADWGRLAGLVPLGVLAPEAAVRLLARRTGLAGPEAPALASVASELGFLPLALEQAAAYMARQRVSPDTYLKRLRENPARMHAAGAGQAGQRVIARLWDLHIPAIRDRSPQAARLLAVLARYSPDAVPRPVAGGHAPGEDTDEALGLLASYSMITLTRETASMHRLLQAVIIRETSGEEGPGLLRTAVE